MPRKRFSVKTQVIWLLAVLVLPVSVTAVGYIWIARQAYEQQSRESVRHTVEIFLNQVTDRMSSADTYLAACMEENVYVAQLYQMETHGEDIRAENFFWQCARRLQRRLTGRRFRPRERTVCRPRLMDFTRRSSTGHTTIRLISGARIPMKQSGFWRMPDIRRMRTDTICI